MLKQKILEEREHSGGGKSILPEGKQWIPHQSSKEKMRRVFQIAKLHAKKGKKEHGIEFECSCETCNYFFKMINTVNEAKPNG